MAIDLVIGTRGSPLARAQSGWVAGRLMEMHPGLRARLEVVRTLGDLVQDRPLAQLGRTGAFTAELERALLNGEVDAAVHSLKDLPTESDPGLTIAAIPSREDPRDALVLSSDTMDRIPSGELASLPLPASARVGTSSVRRRAQLLHHRPDLRFIDVRGNVDTRLRNLEEGKFDAGVLAAAGLRRLGVDLHAYRPLHPLLCTPDPGQGALALQIRADRHDLIGLVQALDDPSAHACVDAERAVLAALGGGCSTPIGAIAMEGPDGALRLIAVVASPDGARLLRVESLGSLADPFELGRRAAAELCASGALDLLDREKGRVTGAA